jgi:hypothetical protein
MRYRLRTLLIAVTLFAFGLGVTAWARRPSLYVPVQVFDTGSVTSGTSGSSVFKVVNRGSRQVKLRNALFAGKGGFADDCEVFIPPGKSHNVVIYWTAPSTATVPEQRIVSCTMHTSDPNRSVIAFEVVGQIK